MADTPNFGAISAMRVAELRELAKELNLDVDPKARKAELLEEIRKVVPARRGRPSKAAKQAVEAASAGNQTSTPADKAAGAAEENTASAASHTENESAPQRRVRQRRPRAQEVAEEENHAVIELPQPKEGSRRGGARQASMSDEERQAALEAIGDAAERHASSDNAEGEGEETSRRTRRRRRRNHHETESGSENAREENRSRGNRNQDARCEDHGSRQQNGQDGRNRDARNNQDRTNNDARNDHRGEEALLPVAGIVDIAGKQAYLRTGGYLPGPNDAQISPQIMKEYGLRRGDAVTGVVRPKEEGNAQPNNQHGRGRGRGRRKPAARKPFNQLVRVSAINSLTPEQSAKRPEFTRLTPLYPNELLRMETTSKAVTARAIDLVAPIGKGQRGLIVAPPKAGKTMVLQQIANSVAANNPDVHLMVVLVDERPEEVTDMRRVVKGEVIASTFDRPASDHAQVAELAIARAKRLVELGQDVVVLLDSLTRLSRAYNLAQPASGRILSGGVDAGALYPPKRFFGAARNIENGGSLTIIATALVETGSKMDEVIFEEFKGTGNMELRLSRQLADRRIFPAIDVNASGTRREELLYSAEELKVIWQLRRGLGSLSTEDASDFFLKRLKATENNGEFLVSIMRSLQNQARTSSK